jgi:hypothetical protein
VPIRLRIEQRQRVANGQTKKFPVVVVELRGATAGQILGGVIPGITAREQAALGASNAPAIEAGTDWANLIESATTRDELLGIRGQAKAAGVNLDQALAARAEALGVAVKLETPADPNALWTQILAGTPDGWLTADLEIDFAKVTGVDCAVATADDMRRYLQAAKA